MENEKFEQKSEMYELKIDDFSDVKKMTMTAIAGYVVGAAVGLVVGKVFFTK